MALAKFVCQAMALYSVFQKKKSIKMYLYVFGVRLCKGFLEGN